MKHKFSFSASSLFFLLLAALVLTTSHSAADEADRGLRYARDLSLAFERVADRVSPAVVNISASAEVKTVSQPIPYDPFFEQFREFFGDDLFRRFQPPQGRRRGPVQQGMGSGFVLSEDGHIVTNYHVVGKADEINVQLQDGRTFEAEIVGSDPRTDIAVIKIEADSLTPASLGDSDDLRIGEWVVAIGNPFGLEHTITAGIVSAKGRSVIGGGQYEDFIQTDAAINPGNSGGPLVNLAGEIVGINTAIFSRSGGYMGIGFAIPSSMAQSVVESLIDTGKVIRGWLGVGIQNLTPEMAKSFDYSNTKGALVGHIEPDGPADKAGIKQGDIIFKMNGKHIESTNELRNQIAATKPGTKISLSVFRNEREKTLQVRLGTLNPEKLEAAYGQEPRDELQTIDTFEELGLRVQTLTPERAEQLGLDTKEGVLVTGIARGGLAAQSGIQVKDIIKRVNGKTVRNLRELEDAFDTGSLQKGVRLIVETQGMERFVFLRLAD